MERKVFICHLQRWQDASLRIFSHKILDINYFVFIWEPGLQIYIDYAKCDFYVMSLNFSKIECLCTHKLALCHLWSFVIGCTTTWIVELLIIDYKDTLSHFYSNIEDWNIMGWTVLLLLMCCNEGDITTLPWLPVNILVQTNISDYL